MDLRLSELRNIVSDINESNNVSALENEKEYEEEVKQKENEFVSYPEEKIKPVCWSYELFYKIKKYGWKILSYAKLLYIPEYACNDTLEKYECEYNGWRFTINNMYDCDIEEGIFGIYSITKNEETIEYYLDVGCRNTGKERFERFIKLLNSNNFDEYFNNEYGKYVELESLLKQKGYKTEIVKFDKKDISKRSSIVIKVDNVWVVLYETIVDDIRLVVTNDSKWDVNSSNKTLNSKKAYTIDYSSSEDIDKLCYAIEMFKRDVNGECGYPYKDGYFTDRDLSKFFSSFKNKVNYDAWNTYQIQLKFHDIWGMRGYGNSHRIANLLDGPTMHSEMQVIFNDAAQWSHGNTAFVLAFVVDYNKEKDEKIRLNVYGYKYDNRTKSFEFKNEDAEIEYENSEDYEPCDWDYAKLDFEHKILCDVDELKSSIASYIKEMSDMFGIENNINKQ